MRTILDKLREVRLKVKPSKCVLFKTEIQYLGHLVSEAGINPMPDKIQALKDWPTPNCLTDVRAFLGLASYYRKFVRGFATIAEPLTALMRKKVRFTWSQEAQQAFNRLKEALMGVTSLSFPNDSFLLANNEPGTETILHNQKKTVSRHLCLTTLSALPHR